MVSGVPSRSSSARNSAADGPSVNESVVPSIRAPVTYSGTCAATAPGVDRGRVEPHEQAVAFARDLVRRRRIDVDDDAAAVRRAFGADADLRDAHVANQNQPRRPPDQDALAGGRTERERNEVDRHLPDVPLARDRARQLDDATGGLHERLARHGQDALAARFDHEPAGERVFGDLGAKQARHLIERHHVDAVDGPKG